MNSTATPGPRPGPRPGATPTKRPSVQAVRVPASDPSQFGRVDDDGSVYAQGLDGQTRQIGSWQAGTPAEGLAHYGVRFDDLATEVELLAARVASHPDEAATIKKTAHELNDGLPEAKVIGDLAALRSRLEAIIVSCDEAAAKVQAAREDRRAKAIEKKKALILEAQKLSETSTEWKAAGDRLRAILDEWKTIRGIDRSTDDDLWKQYAKARDTFNRRRGAHFAELDRTRAQARTIKEDLVSRAQALQDSTEWGDTAKAFAALMTEWKAAGRAPRDVDDKLWAQFKAAQDHFFDARHADSRKRDEEFAANAVAKQELLDHYRPLIDPDRDLEGARAKLRELQDKWEQIGYVPRDRVREFERAIGDLEAKVSETADAQWRRTDPEAQARAAQFIAKVKELTAEAEAADAKGNGSKAEKLRAQAAQWKEWADAAVSAIDNR